MAESLSNDSSEIEALRAENNLLREKLAKAERERGWYLAGIYELTRNNHEFEDLDFDELLRQSAGSLELIELDVLNEPIIVSSSS